MAAFVLSTPIDSLRCGSMEEALETAQEDYPQMILGPPHNGRVPIYADKASQNIGLVAVWLREVA